MTLPRTRLARWIAPAAVLATVLAIAGWRSGSADATPALPKLTAAQLLVKVAQSHVESLSGVVHTSTDLGLPALPDAGGALSPQVLLSGRHTLRVYLDGPDRQRVDLLGTLAETNMVHAGRDLWQWSSSTNKVTHSSVNSGGASAEARARPPAGTPQALAGQLLASIDPTTVVTVGTAAFVAGRPAYDLRLSPKSADSLIARADLYVDSTTGLPLRATLLARGATKPAVDVAFTSLDLSRPAARIFHFSPPPGAKVSEQAGPAGRPGVASKGKSSRTPPVLSPVRAGGPTVLGTGWTAVAELRTGALPAGDRQVQMVLRGAEVVSGRFGSGRLLRTRVVTLLLTDDGRVFAGAVTPQALLRAADSAGHG
ncbi:MAG: hypothetical protein M3042_01620 [Actinomycetota bacterium]|nr:hypothetical protein [Actinomycetota bacterium]